MLLSRPQFPGFTGRLRKEKGSPGNPDATRAANTADGPGIGTTSWPASRTDATIRWREVLRARDTDPRGATVLDADAARCGFQIFNTDADSGDNVRCAPNDYEVTTTTGALIRAGERLEVERGAGAEWRCIRTTDDSVAVDVVEEIPHQFPSQWPIDRV